MTEYGQTNAPKPSIINILIDWDNVHSLWKGKGVKYVVSECISKAKIISSSGLLRVKARLYGGWFLEASLSRQAQDLTAEIQRAYPYAHSNSETSKVIVDAELATSVAQDTKSVFTHTFRQREFSGKIVCGPRPFIGCIKPANCPAITLSAILDQQKCSDHGCSVSVESMLSRAEQKLVDTVLALDIAFYSRFQNRNIVVVTSDDDIVPAMHVAILNGAKVTHIHPTPGRATPGHYARIFSGNYKAISFEYRT